MVKNEIQFNSIVYFRHTFGPYHIIICHNTIEKCKSNIYMTACVKGMVLYSAISSPLDRSKRFTLSSPGRPVHSNTVLGFSWKHSSHAAIAQRLYSLTFPPLSIARYSFIQLSRLRRREVKENAQTSKR